MSAPEPISALGGKLAPRLGPLAGVTISERSVDFVTIAARRNRAKELDDALQRLLGLGLPEAGGSATAGDVSILWTAPATALAIGPQGSLALLAEKIPRDIAAVVDQSGGFCLLRVAGPKARAALAKGCRIDLHPSAFGPDDVARTIIAQTPTIIRQVDDAPTYDMIAPRTLARSFADFMIRAAEEFGVAIAPASTTRKLES